MVYRKPLKAIEGHDRDRLLDAMGRCRSVVTHLGYRMKYGSPTYRALDAVKDAIDGVARIVTGDAELYWSQGTTSLPKWTDKGTK